MLRLGPRHFPLVAAAVVLGACLATSVSVAGPLTLSTTPASGTAAAGSATAAPLAGIRTHRQLAEIDASALVTAIRLPEGSRVITDPAAVLADGRRVFLMVGAETPFFVDHVEFAQAPESANGLLNWVSNDPPIGFATEGTASSSGPGFLRRADTFQFAPIGPLNSRQLVIAAINIGRNKCLVRVDAVVDYAPQGSGQVSGRLETVGGPAPGTPRGVPGRVVFLRAAFSGRAVPITVTTTANGYFHVRLPTYLYWVSGRSPFVKVNGKEELCERRSPLNVRNRSVLRGIDVVCSVK